MPYSKMDEVPDSIKTHQDAPLTLAQANHWARIYDAVKANSGVDSPAAVAWTTWEKAYELKDGKWAKRESAKAEGIALETTEAVQGVQIIAESAGLPSEADVELVVAGPTKTKERFYDREGLIDAAERKIFDGKKNYDKHVDGAEQIPGAVYKPRNITEMLSWITRTWWDEKRGALMARVKLCSESIKTLLKDAWQVIGMSITAIGETYIGQDGLEHVKRIREAISAEWVPDPNAGSKVVQLIEAVGEKSNPSEETKNMGAVLNSWSELTLEMLKANRADLYEQCKEAAKQDQDWLRSAAENLIKQAVDAAKTEAGAATTAAKTESQAVKAELHDQGVKLAESQAKVAQLEAQAKTAQLVEEATKDMPPLARVEVLRLVEAKKPANETALAEAITAAVAEAAEKLKAQPPAPAQPAADADGKPPEKKLPTASAAMAEGMGIAEEQRKRLAEV